MKEQFLEFMRAVPFRGPANQHELRDLICVYAAGWKDGCQTVLGRVADGELIDSLSDHNWWPDESWDWTK